MATIVPFALLILLTIFLLDHRVYEIEEKEIQFQPDYHIGPKQEVTKASALSEKPKQTFSPYVNRDLTNNYLPDEEEEEVQELTIKLLQSYLDEPSRLSVPVPDLEQQQYKQKKPSANAPIQF